MKYTKIPTETFENIQLNAGVLVKSFTPATGEFENIIGATTGGLTFAATPTYTDFGDDIDNCPKNMKELKKLESWEAKLSGTYVTFTAEQIKGMLGAADIDSTDPSKIIPRKDIKQSDFDDIWLVADYSSINDGTKAGYVAIHIMNALATGGFQLKTADKGKGQSSFEYTAHYSMNAQDTVPFEIYIKEGTAA